MSTTCRPSDFNAQRSRFSISSEPASRIRNAHKIFFSLYFALTGVHALHMIVGIGIFSVITFMAWRGKFCPEYHTPVEIAGVVLALRGYRLDLSLPALIPD